jgi:hypothetical protein
VKTVVSKLWRRIPKEEKDTVGASHSRHRHARARH